MRDGPLDYERNLKWVTRQTARRVVCIIRFIVQELLQQIDLDYYRSVRLVIVQPERKQLPRTCGAGDLQRRDPPRIDEVA